jgi:hypothetical protein
VQRPSPLRGRIVAQLLERPHEIDGGRPGCREDAVRLVEILPAICGERVSVAGRDPDGGRATYGEHTDRLGDLGRALAAKLDLLVREPALVQQDDSASFQTKDALGV